MEKVKRMLTVVVMEEEYQELKRLTHHGEISGILRMGMNRWINEKKREIAILEAIEKNPEMRREIEEILKESGLKS